MTEPDMKPDKGSWSAGDPEVASAGGGRRRVSGRSCAPIRCCAQSRSTARPGGYPSPSPGRDVLTGRAADAILPLCGYRCVTERPCRFPRRPCGCSPERDGAVRPALGCWRFARQGRRLRLLGLECWIPRYWIRIRPDCHPHLRQSKHPHGVITSDHKNTAAAIAKQAGLLRAKRRPATNWTLSAMPSWMPARSVHRLCRSMANRA